MPSSLRRRPAPLIRRQSADLANQTVPSCRPRAAARADRPRVTACAVPPGRRVSSGRSPAWRPRCRPDADRDRALAERQDDGGVRRSRRRAPGQDGGRCAADRRPSWPSRCCSVVSDGGRDAGRRLRRRAVQAYLHLDARRRVRIAEPVPAVDVGDPLDARVRLPDDERGQPCSVSPIAGPTALGGSCPSHCRAACSSRPAARRRCGRRRARRAGFEVDAAYDGGSTNSVTVPPRRGGSGARDEPSRTTRATRSGDGAASDHDPTITVDDHRRRPPRHPGSLRGAARSTSRRPRRCGRTPPG